ncbi:hypothetical protein LEP1GSC061_0112 [Leptospira wolffii serovar Khorat str. Khorat-H2]|nr:hypothetical protein LEP1GSC061_0112 [Leptospira wolffii serovar Khorat str. Khorat-H2]
MFSRILSSYQSFKNNQSSHKNHLVTMLTGSVFLHVGTVDFRIE